MDVMLIRTGLCDTGPKPRDRSADEASSEPAAGGAGQERGDGKAEGAARL